LSPAIPIPRARAGPRTGPEHSGGPAAAARLHPAGTLGALFLTVRVLLVRKAAR
jgi:hypothetical protein